MSAPSFGLVRGNSLSASIDRLLLLAIIILIAGIVLAPPTVAAGLYWLTARSLGWPEPSFGVFIAMVAAWGALVAAAIVAYGE